LEKLTGEKCGLSEVFEPWIKIKEEEAKAYTSSSLKMSKD